MTSSADIHRASHDAFNARDWDRMRSLLGDSVTYRDRARAVELTSPDDFLGWAREWTTAMSDAQVTQAEYIDGGEWSVCRFTGVGTNDGPIGPVQTGTGKRLELAYCELIRVQDGKVTGGEMYYDQLTLLSQLGLAEMPLPA
jgi:steroid delta-isomerase-like uncharacterized protein